MSDEDRVSETSAGEPLYNVGETTPPLSNRPGYVVPVMTRSRARLTSVDTAIHVVHPSSDMTEQTEAVGIVVDALFGEGDSIGHPPTSTDEEGACPPSQSPPSSGTPPSLASLGNPPSLSSLGEPLSCSGEPSDARLPDDVCSVGDPSSFVIDELSDSDDDVASIGQPTDSEGSNVSGQDY